VSNVEIVDSVWPLTPNERKAWEIALADISEGVVGKAVVAMRDAAKHKPSVSLFLAYCRGLMRSTEAAPVYPHVQSTPKRSSEPIRTQAEIAAWVIEQKRVLAEGLDRIRENSEQACAAGLTSSR
jgi:hypothetical protein